MKAFEMVYPGSVQQALELLADDRDPNVDEEARILAGGQDLLTELKDRLRSPARLVNIKRIPDLDRIDFGREVALIGALATVAELAAHPLLRERFAVLAEAAESVASPQIRNLGTVGGNLCQKPRCWYYRKPEVRCIKRGGGRCYAYDGLSKFNAILGGGPVYIVHPSDLAPALVALDATVAIAGTGGERRLPLERFFLPPAMGGLTRENVLAAREMLTRVELPLREGWRSTYLKFRERGSFDWALASVALAVRMDGEKIAEARLCLGGVAPIPWRSRSAERILRGKKLDDAALRAAAGAALEGARPLAHNGYKVPLAKGLILKAGRKLRRS